MTRIEMILETLGHSVIWRGCLPERIVLNLGKLTTNQSADWGRRLVRKRQSTSLGLFRHSCVIVRLKRDGTRAETIFRLSPKRTSPFKSAGASVQLTAGSRGVRISVSNAGYATFRGSVIVMTTHSIRQFPLHFPCRASPCAIRFQMRSTTSLGLRWR